METGELVLGIQKTEFAASTGSPVHPLSVWKFHCQSYFRLVPLRFSFFNIFCIFFYFYFNLLDLFHFSTLVQECLVMLTVFFRGSIQSFPILILASLFRGRHSGSLPLLFHQPSPSPSRLSLHLPVFSSRLPLLLLSGRSIDISPISISTSPKLKSQPHRILSPNSSTLTVPLNSLTISAFLSVRQSHCL